VDLSTVFGVFCREDYRLDGAPRIVVDIGANIGVASVYFLTRSKDTFVYAFEPVPRNVRAFRENVAPYENRCQLEEVAVGITSGPVEFGVEPTGKFGGIDVKSDSKITVECVSINTIVETVLLKHGRINCLKLDVEGSEHDILAAMDRKLWDGIDCIYAENCNSKNFMPPGFERSFNYNVEKITKAA
jgi:FkbM family methyltransferase